MPLAPGRGNGGSTRVIRASPDVRAPAEAALACTLTDPHLRRGAGKQRGGRQMKGIWVGLLAAALAAGCQKAVTATQAGHDDGSTPNQGAPPDPPPLVPPPPPPQPPPSPVVGSRLGAWGKVMKWPVGFPNRTI